jgi:hypothetical protein
MQTRCILLILTCLIYIAFFGASIFHIMSSIVFHFVNKYQRAVFKALPIWILSLHTITRLSRAFRKNWYIFSWTVVLLVAQVLHSVGDILMEGLGSEVLVALGASSFLIGHISNIFILSMKNAKDKPAGYWRLWLYIPFGICTIAVIVILFVLSQQKKDVVLYIVGVIYVIILFAAAWRAAARVLHPGESILVNSLVAIGYVMFCFSDLVLIFGIVKVFTVPEPARGIMIMATYYLGCGLIAITVDREDPLILERWIYRKQTEEKKPTEEQSLLPPSTVQNESK